MADIINSATLNQIHIHSEECTDSAENRGGVLTVSRNEVNDIVTCCFSNSSRACRNATLSASSMYRGFFEKRWCSAAPARCALTMRRAVERLISRSDKGNREHRVRLTKVIFHVSKHHSLRMRRIQRAPFAGVADDRISLPGTTSATSTYAQTINCTDEESSVREGYICKPHESLSVVMDVVTKVLFDVFD
jgi:hypothetical protein